MLLVHDNCEKLRINCTRTVQRIERIKGNHICEEITIVAILHINDRNERKALIIYNNWETGETRTNMIPVQFGTSRNQSLTLTDCDRHSLIFYIRRLLMRDSRAGRTFLNFVKSVSRKTESNHLASP